MSWAGSALARLRQARALRRCDLVGAQVVLEGPLTVRNQGRVELGDGVHISSSPVASHLVVGPAGRLVIEDQVTIAHGAAIAANFDVRIGRGSQLGPFAVIMDTDFHVAGAAAAQAGTSPVLIGRDVTIGSRVTILPGATIGDGARIEAGSVVVGRVAPAAHVAGVPARPVAAAPAARLGDRQLELDVPRLVQHTFGLAAAPELERQSSSILGWDSLGTLKLVMELEEAFDVGLDEQALRQVKRVADVVEVVRQAFVRGQRPAVRRARTTSDEPAGAAPELIFEPTAEQFGRSQLAAFTRWLSERTGATLDTPAALHTFSVERFRDFWRGFVEWSGLQVEGELEPVCEADAIEAAVFFPRLRLNFAENLLAGDDALPAITACDESGAAVKLTRGQLRDQVLRVAAALLELGVGPEDRVVAICANTAETVVAALACSAIGAVWSSISADLGVEAIVARFSQLAPKGLVYHASSLEGGTRQQHGEKVAAVLRALPTVTLAVALREALPKVPASVRSVTLGELSQHTALGRLERFGFNHPLYILYSSGTTGVPKCIVHGAGGTLLEHHKEHRLHGDLGPGDTLYFQTTCAWMMWNWLVCGLSARAQIVTREGSATWPSADALWRLVEEHRVTVFGTSPAFLQFSASAGVVPRERFDLSSLRQVLSTGSVLPPAAFAWVKRQVAEVPVHSISGGTDIIGCFLLGHPGLPVYAGELVSPSLGLQVEALGSSAEHPVGELVCRTPFPSRPLGLYGDVDGNRFHDAYFRQNFGVWTHGDLLEKTPRGTFKIHGRSDGVMNIRGVRIGPAEIYRALDGFDAVRECMAVEQRAADEPGGSRQVLLVVLADRRPLDAALTEAIRQRVRERCSAAHVPAVVMQVDELPVTHNGKRAERAARDALNGVPVANLAALKNPDCLNALRTHSETAANASRPGNAKTKQGRI